MTRFSEAKERSLKAAIVRSEQAYNKEFARTGTAKRLYKAWVSAVRRFDNYRDAGVREFLGRRKNPTKAQKREKTRKVSAKRRVAVALKNFLKKANPACKYAGAKMQRNKGGSITIIPIKLRRAK